MRKLTIGMATYDDYDGAYFTIQAIMLYHPDVLKDLKILVVDNNPKGKVAEHLERLCEALPIPARYIPCDDIVGTAVKGRVFEESDTPYTMCVDSHVLIQPMGIRRLIEQLDKFPDSKNLYHGPLLYDNHKTINTHFDDTWGSGMKGQWACDNKGIELDGIPFEISSMGMGLAACHTAAWPGYNKNFKGFFVEEKYVHAKFRNNGGRVICLPFLRWLHRFARPYGTKYPNIWKDRVLNYLYAYDELGWDRKEMLDHFNEHLNKPLIDSIVTEYERRIQNG